MVEYPSFSPVGQLPQNNLLGADMPFSLHLPKFKTAAILLFGVVPVWVSLLSFSFLLIGSFGSHRDTISTDAIIVCLSCLDIRPFKKAEFWRKILNYLRKELHEEPYFKSHLESLEKKTEITNDDLEQVLEQIGRTDRYLLLLLDDYDVALRPHEEYTEVEMENFLFQCRYLAYSSPQSYHLSMVVSSLRRLNELGSSSSPQ